MKKFSLVVLAVIFSLTNVSAEQTKDFNIISPSKIKRLLGNYPAPGSAEELADVQTLLTWQNKRTTEDCNHGDSQADDISVRALFTEYNGPITADEADRLERVLLSKKISAGANIYLAKNLYKRPRPYDAHREIKPCIALESSYAYPSGHTTLVQFYGKLLSDMYPERALLIKKHADKSSLLRVIGGVHYPSDVVAGKKLADELYRLAKLDD